MYVLYYFYILQLIKNLEALLTLKNSIACVNSITDT